MDNKLTVIYYHDIVEKGNGMSYQRVEINKFEKQMSYLQENGYNSISLEDIDKPFPEKAILVTFDDGFKSVYNVAFPVMQKLNIKGNIFLATRYINESQNNFLNWNDIKILKESGLFSFGAHTHNHVDIRLLSDDELLYEVTQSNNLINKNVGIKPNSFCIPYGKYNKRTITSIANYGDYKYMFTSNYGQFIKKNRNIQKVNRIGISNYDSIDVFEKKLKGRYNFKGYLQKLRLYIENILNKRVKEYDF